MAMHVELVSPELILFSGEAEMVICRTVGGGDIAFLANHAPFLGALDVAPVRIRKTDGEWEEAAVHGGFVHVRDNTDPPVGPCGAGEPHRLRPGPPRPGRARTQGDGHRRRRDRGPAAAGARPPVARDRRRGAGLVPSVPITSAPWLRGAGRSFTPGG